MNKISDSKQFRAALGSFATGVTIVTARSPDGVDVGLTANSFNSVSLDPPMVLWSLGKHSSQFPSFMKAEYFAVHILASDQEDLSNRFAKSGADKFAGLECGRGINNVPLLDGCSARFQCRVAMRHESGDHVIVVGEVLSFDSSTRSPLVFHGGKYSQLIKRRNGELEPDWRIGEDWLSFLLRRAYHQLVWPLRNQATNNGLSSVHFSILSILSMGERRTTDEVCLLLNMVGLAANSNDFEQLVTLGLVELDGEPEKQTIGFTERGRAFAIDLTVAEKAAEENATRGLDYDEIMLFKYLLRRIITDTEADLPPHWRREKVWLDNNIWSPSCISDPGQKLSQNR